MHTYEVSWLGAEQQVISRMFFARHQNGLGVKGAMGPLQALQDEEGAAAVADIVGALQLPGFIPADLNMSGTEGDATIHYDGVFDRWRSHLGDAALGEGLEQTNMGWFRSRSPPMAARRSRRTTSKIASS